MYVYAQENRETVETGYTATSIFFYNEDWDFIIRINAEFVLTLFRYFLEEPLSSRGYGWQGGERGSCPWDTMQYKC